MKILILIILFACSLNASDLSDAANSLNPGEWIFLSTNGFTKEFLNHGTTYVFAYSDKGVWDPINRKAHFIGAGYSVNSRHIVYDEETNTWILEMDDNEVPWAKGASSSHGYEHIAIDVDGRKLYTKMFNDQDLWYRDLDNNAGWTNTSSFSSRIGVAGALAFFPEMGCLFVNFGEKVVCYYRSTDSWGDYQDPNQSSYHNLAIYNPVHRWVGFGGGDGDNHFYKYDSTGTITPLTSCRYLAAP